MDLSRAEKILDDLQSSSKKVTKISDAIDHLAAASKSLSNLSSEFKNASKKIVQIQNDSKKNQEIIISEIEPVIKDLNAHNKNLISSTKKLEIKASKFDDDISKSIDSIQARICEEISSLNQGVISQVNSNRDFTSEVIQKVELQVSKVNSEINQLTLLVQQDIKISEDVTKKINSMRYKLYILIALLLINPILIAKLV